MIVTFYVGWIIKDERKDYTLINKTISNGIIQEFYHSQIETEIQKEIASLKDDLNAAQEAIDFLVEIGGDVWWRDI